jgi:competence protein CoiA
MQVYALNSRKERVFVEWAEKAQDYTCIECGATLRLRGGPHVQLHFYHYGSQEVACRLSAKSQEHLELQSHISRLCGPSASQEVRFESIGRIADVAWEEQKIIFEIQCSPISAEEVESRIMDYNSLGWSVIWILYDRCFRHRKETGAEHFLEAHPHYFFHGHEIYDCYDLCFQGMRLRKSHERFIDITQIKKRAQAGGTTLLPRVLEKRAATWPLHIQDDFLDHIDNPHFFEADCLFEKNLISPPQKKQGIERYFQIFKEIYYLLLERSCR